MNCTVERLEQIEQEREQTMSNPNYQKWIQELNISRSYSDPSAYLQAKDIVRQYDYSNYRYKIA